MRLNLHILSDTLALWGFDGPLVGTWSRRTCTHPLLAPAPLEVYGEGPLYVTTAEALGSDPRVDGIPSLVVVGKPAPAWLEARCNLMWTETAISINLIANALSEQFARYQEWVDEMQRMVDEGASPASFAACSKGIFSNPIYAMGPEMYLICSYTPRVEPDTPRYAAYRQRYNTDYGVYEGPEIVVDSLTMEDYFDIEPTPEPTIVRSPFGHDVLYHTIYLHDMPLATVCVDGIASPISDRDKALSVIWGQHLLRLLAGDTGRMLRQERQEGETLHGLLDHVMQSERHIQSFLRNYGWEDQDEYLCAIARNNGSRSEVALEYLALSIVRNMGNACYEIRGEGAVIILNLTKLGVDKETMLRRLRGLLARKDVTISLSNTFQGFRYVWYFYQQALATERLGQKAEPELWMFRYEDFELWDMVERVSRGSIAQVFVPEGLARLVKYDKDRNGIYVDTLKTYLECERNVAETSRRLYVHRNTFLYRLSRIQDLLDMNLDDPDVRIVLLLALRILERNSA